MGRFGAGRDSRSNRSRLEILLERGAMRAVALLVVALTIALLLPRDASAVGSVASDSNFDGYSWNGAAGFTRGGAGAAGANAALSCGSVYEWLDRYSSNEIDDPSMAEDTDSGAPVSAPGLT